jgi:sugar/nucleoside kinase (ribokinase family)
MHFGVTGEISHDRLTQPGMAAWEGLGGCSVYLALGLARLGVPVTFATLGGDDLDPAWLEPLCQAGVDLRLARLAGPTARLELGYDAQGDIARLRFQAGVERHMHAGQLPPDFWAADWAVVGTAPRSYQAAVLQRAGALGRPAALSTQREFQADWASLAGMLPHLNTLFINSGEVFGLRGDSLPEGLAALRAANPGLTCVVTCGRRGAFLLYGPWLYWAAACPAAVVNTTGAGDAFAAAWLVTLAHTGDPAHALRAASAAASLALRGPAHTALPTADQVQRELHACGETLAVARWPVESSQAQAALAAEDAHCHRALDRRVRRI